MFRVDMVFHTHVYVFNRLISFRFDLLDWVLKFKKTTASVMIYVGPFHLGYTNQNKMHEYLKDLIEQIDQDFQNYQVSDKQIENAPTDTVFH